MASDPPKLPQISKFAGESLSTDNVRTILVGSDPLNKTINFQSQDQCIILLIGPNTVPKSILIDAFCNVFYGIDYKTPFRTIISNAITNSSKQCLKITKYKFTKTKFLFQPVFIDIPNININAENLASAIELIIKHLQQDAIHAILFALPDPIDTASTFIFNSLQQILSVLPKSLVNDLVAFSIAVKSDAKIKTSNDYVDEIGIYGEQTYFLNLSSLYLAPVDDFEQEKKQEQQYCSFTEKLFTFMLRINQLNAAKVEKGMDSVSGQNKTLSQISDFTAAMTTDSIDAVIKRKQNVGMTRPTSLVNVTNYTYFPTIGWVPKPKFNYIPESIDSLNLETGILINLKRHFNLHNDDLIPRVVMPNQKNSTKFSFFKTVNSATTLSEGTFHSRIDFSQKNFFHGSGQFATSEWTYNSCSNELIFNLNKLSGFNPLKAPPKPPRAVDPEFQDDQICNAETLLRITDDDNEFFEEEPIYKRIQTKGFYPKRLPVPKKQSWVNTSLGFLRPTRRTRTPVESPRLLDGSILFRRKRRLRLRGTTIQRMQAAFIGLNSCFFYCLVSIFITLFIAFIIATIVLMVYY